MFVKICKYHFSLFCNACTLTLKIEVPFIEKMGTAIFTLCKAIQLAELGGRAVLTSRPHI